MDILEIRKNFNKPVVIDFKQLNLSNVSNTKEKNLSIKLQMTIFKHYESVEETGDVLMGDEENKDVGFPIKIMRKKIKATGIKNSILDHLEDIIKQIHGSFMTKEQMIIILNEKFSDIPKKTLDNFFKDKCLKVKHNINQKKYRFKALGDMQIIFNHLSPLCLDLHIRICVTVSRQIYQIHGVIDIIEVDRLCLTRLR